MLWHLKVSHYNEKVRWALDHKGIPHVRRAVGPTQHKRIAKRLTGGVTTPVLELDGRAIRDSSRIIAELERRAPEPPLHPADPAERERALEIEDWFDEELGPYTRMLVMHHTLPEPRLFLGTFDSDLRGVRLAAVLAMYPLVRRRVGAEFDIQESSVALAYERCRAACERFRDELGSREYLVGGRFTVADLTVAALVAPVVCPPEFPYPQPQRGHPRLAALREVFEESDLADWSRDMYARHRSVSAETPQHSQAAGSPA